MNRILKHTLLPTLVATSLVGVNLVCAKPASANDNWIRDIGIGAATGVVTGAVTHDGSTISNVLNGAGAGAAVHAASDGNHHSGGDLLRDVGVGAAAGTVSGAITNHRHPINNVINGAATGAIINVLGR
jgi:hypothetical protein